MRDEVAIRRNADDPEGIREHESSEAHNDLQHIYRQHQPRSSDDRYRCKPTEPPAPHLRTVASVGAITGATLAMIVAIRGLILATKLAIRRLVLNLKKTSKRAYSVAVNNEMSRRDAILTTRDEVATGMGGALHLFESIKIFIATQLAASKPAPAHKWQWFQDHGLRKRRRKIAKPPPKSRSNHRSSGLMDFGFLSILTTLGYLQYANVRPLAFPTTFDASQSIIPTSYPSPALQPSHGVSRILLSKSDEMTQLEHSQPRAETLRAQCSEPSKQVANIARGNGISESWYHETIEGITPFQERAQVAARCHSKPYCSSASCNKNNTQPRKVTTETGQGNYSSSGMSFESAAK
ncbi:hypothetical protein FB567DRAFT_555800 [Paraphoma chrysanthemicola]|uniref:Uncharacterized protein n=1 Tax=Paraphoma chrysanthemicola TaxID=798071 RepID=A0A8K0VR71_9PLEO|nr:hypothetical protein FB567DRAFT_555800 [Paraphoma chrysanthemicola]